MSTRNSATIIAASVLTLLLLSQKDAVAALHSGGVSDGQQVFRMCAGCHSLSPGVNKAGPSLAGLFGRRAGSVPGFAYSAALKGSGVVWNDRTLDAWIAAPQQFVPGNRMRFPGVWKSDQREALIDYLRAATKPKASGGATQ